MLTFLHATGSFCVSLGCPTPLGRFLGWNDCVGREGCIWSGPPRGSREASQRSHWSPTRLAVHRNHPPPVLGRRRQGDTSAWREWVTSVHLFLLFLSGYIKRKLFPFIFLKKFIFYWSIVDLQCCISFRSAKWFRYIYMHIYVFFFRFFSHTCYYKILSIAPCTAQ